MPVVIWRPRSVHRSIKILRRGANLTVSRAVADTLSITLAKETIMATGAKPALKPLRDNKTEAEVPSDAKPATLKDRIIRKLTEIFKHNESLGVTRQG